MLQNTNDINSVLSVYIVIFLALFLTSFFLIYKSPIQFYSKFGYRTPKSMKNQKNWDYANKLAPRLMIIVSILFIVINLILFYFLNSVISSHFFSLIAITTLIILIVIMIIIIEIKLNRFEKK